jgi:hypothetical protein
LEQDDNGDDGEWKQSDGVELKFRWDIEYPVDFDAILDGVVHDDCKFLKKVKNGTTTPLTKDGDSTMDDCCVLGPVGFRKAIVWLTNDHITHWNRRFTTCECSRNSGSWILTVLAMALTFGCRLMMVVTLVVCSRRVMAWYLAPGFSGEGMEWVSDSCISLMPALLVEPNGCWNFDCLGLKRMFELTIAGWMVQWKSSLVVWILMMVLMHATLCQLVVVVLTSCSRDPPWYGSVVGPNERLEWMSNGFRRLMMFPFLVTIVDQLGHGASHCQLDLHVVSEICNVVVVDCCFGELMADGSNFVFDPGGYRGVFRVFFGDFSSAGCVRFDASGSRGVVIVNGFWCISRGFVCTLHRIGSTRCGSPCSTYDFPTDSLRVIRAEMPAESWYLCLMRDGLFKDKVVLPSRFREKGYCSCAGIE